MTYETKCRRCGEIHEWVFYSDPSKTDFENWQALHRYITEIFSSPATIECNLCDKMTIQDYVSLTSRPPE